MLDSNLLQSGIGTTEISCLDTSMYNIHVAMFNQYPLFNKHFLTKESVGTLLR